MASAKLPIASVSLRFLHGYNIHFRQIIPPPDVEVVLMASKSPGSRMRDLYLMGKGVPALVSVGQKFTAGLLKQLWLWLGKQIS